MKLNTFIAAIAVAATSVVALPAVAQSVSAGDIQLARSVGVEPGVFTRAQLVALDQAKREDSAAGRANFAFILKSAGQERVSTSGTAGNASAVNRAILLERAIHDNDTHLIRLLQQPASSVTTADRGAASAGKVQLAAALGVNAVDYTTAELVALQTRVDFADNAK